ncbi:hypothetical protein GCM10022271_21780 [Corallibacter vietnamensis]|uniref:Uncharacterized protein n=1 Tax=Corallibacter vietnamensis TaxID=904130 RepID=A0ABP7HCN6_9FLAO
MRILAFILSTYILALNFAPCEDSVLVDDIKTEISQHADLDHEHNDVSDMCSPFCQCHCCHIHVTNTAKTSYVLITNNIPRHLLLHHKGVEKDFKVSILQPPRV